MYMYVQTGLQDLADTVVGGATGLGLSGGQKRRLVVALQLLKLPSVIFLDEPTSGNLDNEYGWPAACYTLLVTKYSSDILICLG